MIFFISLTNACNYACSYCPMAEWRNKPPVHDGMRSLNSENLLAYLDKFCNAKADSVELTGGEPTLFGELLPLIQGLSKRGIRTVIKSNGSNYIPKLPYVVRVYAWHHVFPTYECEWILIIEHGNWKSRAEQCKTDGIAFKTITGCDRAIPKPIENKGVCFIDEYGGVHACLGRTDGGNNTAARIFGFAPPPPSPLECDLCKSYHDHVLFLEA